MQRLASVVLACALILSHCIPLQAQAPVKAAGTGAPNSAPAWSTAGIDQKVEALLRQMTLAEKVGQLVQYSAGQPTGPGTGRTDYDDMIRKGEIGALFNITGAANVNRYQRIAVENSRLHIPIVFGLDVIHGFRTEFPIPLGLASTWNPQTVEKTARVAASEAAASGVRWTFSPMVDIARDARWGRIAEGAGEDPYLGSVMAAAYVRGYQGSKLGSPDSIAACVKHYVGYGAAEGGRDYNTVEISEHTLRQVYLPPFRSAVDAGAATIMSAFDSLNGVPASANRFTLTQILRQEWGFRGIVDSDWTSIEELINHGIALDGSQAARRAILAGVDMDMAASLYHDHLAKLVQSGQVPQPVVDEAVRRVLRVKFALGLFDHPYTDEKAEAPAMLQPENVTLARLAAEQSFVLLKNDPGPQGSPLLPLAGTIQNVALLGPLADDAGNMLGSWAAQGRPQDAVTLRAALEQKLGAGHVRYAKGVGYLEGPGEDIAGAANLAKDADVAILALGEDAPLMTGEAASRAHLGLPGHQQQLLEAVVATGKPVILLLFSGRPLTIPWAVEHVPVIMEAWFPGVQAGPALVRTLFGDAAPGGRLTVSWPRSVGQEPLYYNALNTGRPAGKVDLTHPSTNTEGKYVSRYIDEQNSPQFPFGYGLSYTTFQYGAPSLSGKQLSARTLNAGLNQSAPRPAVTITADVTNSGKRAGDETVQLYIRRQGASVSLPVRELKGWQRVTLQPGETRKVTFDLSAQDLAFWNVDNKFTTEPSRVTVWVGPDSAHGAEATLDIGE